MKVSAENLPAASLAALAEASAAINSSLDPDVVLDAIARTAAKVMRAEASSVLLLDGRRKTLIFVAAVGDRGDALRGEEFDANLGIAGHVAASGKPELVEDVRDCDHHFAGIDDLSSFQTRGLIAAPMIHKSEVVGVVEVLNRVGGERFDRQDLELLQVFANLAAAGAYNARDHETLRREAEGLRRAVLGSDEFVGQSGALHRVLALCDRVAGSNATVLLLGETGTGKELAAR
ncbi:MAG: GAF domain-containing protein, partial [Planctomycetota bacterium]